MQVRVNRTFDRHLTSHFCCLSTWENKGSTQTQGSPLVYKEWREQPIKIRRDVDANSIQQTSLENTAFISYPELCIKESTLNRSIRQSWIRSERDIPSDSLVTNEVTEETKKNNSNTRETDLTQGSGKTGIRKQISFFSSPLLSSFLLYYTLHLVHF